MKTRALVWLLLAGGVRALPRSKFPGLRDDADAALELAGVADEIKKGDGALEITGAAATRGPVDGKGFDVHEAAASTGGELDEKNKAEVVVDVDRRRILGDVCEYVVVSGSSQLNSYGTYHRRDGFTCQEGRKPLYVCETGTCNGRFIKEPEDRRSRWYVSPNSNCKEDPVRGYLRSADQDVDDPTRVSGWQYWYAGFGDWLDDSIKVQCADCGPGQFLDVDKNGCSPCEAGTFSYGMGNTFCMLCGAGTFSQAGDADCSTCAAGKYGNKVITATACLDCPAGKDSLDKSFLFSQCQACDPGWKSSGGSACTPCGPGEESNSDNTDCVPCDAGYKSSAGGMCTPCAAGKTSNSDHTDCKDCAAGRYSSISNGVWATTDNSGGTCALCGPGKYSTGGQSKCEQCGDGGDAWKLENWDPTQSGLTSDDCECARSRTGTNCDAEECALTTPVVSLGFLVLEVQWPRFVRTKSKNEAFSGISGALRAFDANDDNYLSIEEARRAIRAGGMAVPLELSHIWSRDGVELDEGYVTITEMVQDELDTLAQQQTVEYYDQPSGSGEIETIEATYPNNHDGDKWSNEICAAQSTEPPLLEWTVNRDEKVIYQQCAFLNGEALTGTDGLDNDASGGKSNVDDTDCRGSGGAQECSFAFQLPNADGWPAGRGTIDVGVCGGDRSACEAKYGDVCVQDDDNDEAHGCDLGEVPTPVNYELSFRMAIDAGEKFGDWKSIIHVTGITNQWNVERYPAIFFSAGGKFHIAQSKGESASDEDWNQNVLNSARTFVAGKTYDIRITNVDSKLTLYVDGKLDSSVKGPATYVPPGGFGKLMVGWDAGVGYAPAKATISDARFVEVYPVRSYKPQGDCSAPGTFTYAGRTLRCIELPNGELVDVLEVEGGTETCRYDADDSCPAGYNIWVPRSYEHAKAVRETVDPKFTHLVGVYRELGFVSGGQTYTETSCGGCNSVPMNSEAYDEWVKEDLIEHPNRIPWTSVAGKPWFLRETSYSEPSGDYMAGCWLTTDYGGWDDEVGFRFNDATGAKCNYCFSDYLCSRNGVEYLDISKHSYCVETKFCGCALNLPGPIDVSRGNQVATVDTFENYELTFTMKLASDWSITGERLSIFRIGTGFPGIWFLGDGGLYVSHFSPPSEWGVDQSQPPGTSFTAGQTYEIKVQVESNQMTVYVNGNSVGTASGGTTYTVTDAAVYVGDPLNAAAKVTLSNICLKPIRACDKSYPNIEVTTRCTTGLQYDGEPMDVFPKLLGTQGVALSWLDTSTVATGYRVYKVADLTVPFAEDTSAQLLREFVMRRPDCGLTHAYLDFRDITTGGKPGLYVGYAVVPLDDDGVEDKEKVGESGFYVTWFGDVYVDVVAEGGGPVEDAIVKLSHLVNNALDPAYTNFVEVLTDEYGVAHLEVRVQDPTWSGLTQHFRVDVEKNSTTALGNEVVHKFEPPFEETTVRHLGEATLSFVDETAISISGTVSHDGFGADWYMSQELCPHKKESTEECFCPVYCSAESSSRRSSDDVKHWLMNTQVDGVEVVITRASGAVEEVTVNDGKFSTSAFLGEEVTLGLRPYTGVGDGSLAHDFSVIHDAGDNATTADGQEPTFAYTANEDAEVHFLDTSTQTLAAIYVVGANLATAEYVNGVPVVAKVERCGWEQPAWALRGVAKFELGAAAVEVRALSDGEVLEAKYYYPPGGLDNKFADDCDATERTAMVKGFALSPDERMLRGCRAKIPDVSASATERLPCATMSYEYVDELPEERIFEVDLSALGTGSNATNATIAPTLAPTFAPTLAPTVTGVPIALPTLKPTRLPTAGPTFVPTHEPTPECALSLTDGTSTETFQNYELTFTMELASSWSLTAQQSIIDIGQHLPGLWINYPSGKLEVAQSSSASEYWGVSDVPPTFKAGEHYEIKVVVENNQMTVYVNGKNVGTASGSSTYFMASADVSTGNGVALSGICLREILVPSAAPTAAPTTHIPTLVPTLAPTACKAGYVPDCSITECWLSSWVGDGYCDDQDRRWDADLSCYDYDGGDCAPTPSPTTTLTPTPRPTSGPTPGPTPVPLSVEADAMVKFLISSPLCLASVSATGTKLKKLIDPPKDGGSREYTLDKEENLLLAPPSPEDDGSLYGKACTNDTDAVFREGDAVDLGFKLVEREPNCYEWAVYPWDKASGCNRGYTDSPPTPDHPIAIRVADGVSGTESSATYNGTFTHTMTAGAPNPFAPFSKQLNVEFTRQFDSAEISLVRHALILGVIPEEVPQVWTTAVDNLIFSVLRDPPGGASTATLVEGSTISTSMAIEGAHAATLDDASNWGGSGGIQGGIKISAGVLGFGTIWNGIGFGTKHGEDWSDSASVTVDRGSSTHFDVGLSFDIAISTSDSPYMPGQPSDVIIGGGANLRFISAIEVYATASDDGGLCLAGRQTVQFLPERLTTYVMSVYEIEKTMERLGKAIQDIESGAMKIEDGKEDIDSADLQKQLTNWQTVLANYRATAKTDLKSVAGQLQETLDGLQKNFEAFHEDLKKAEPSELTAFVAGGIKNLKAASNDEAVKSVSEGVPTIDLNDGGISDEAPKSIEGEGFITSNAGTMGQRAEKAANACAVATSLADPGKLHPLCRAYDVIGEKVKLAETLLGVCGFATEGCCDPRIGPTDENGDPTPADDTCAESSVCSSVDLFCKSGTVPGIGSTAKALSNEARTMSAFDFLTNTTKFLTFSGSTGVDFQWNVAESRGTDASVTTEGSFEDGRSYDGNFGFQIGRRLTSESSSSSGPVAGYAYPLSGPVHAVSKKLLEVTPEAFAEKRRKLVEQEAAAAEALPEEENRRRLGIGLGGAIASGANNIYSASSMTKAAGENKGAFLGNPCRRRRLQLGIQGCVGGGEGETESFSVSMSRSANKEAEHTHAVAVSLKDGNAQDVFALKVAMDSVYGTPIFTTLGGRSSCIGETGTTRRDSRVSILKIKHLCSENDPADKGKPICESDFDCECTDLALGEDAIFSVVLENLSPWVTSVKFLLRAVNGASTAWDSGKYAGVVDDACPDGDPGSLEIRAIGSAKPDLRDGDGITFSPLNYGQSEVRIRVSRSDFSPQCLSYSNIQLELVSVCEDTDWDSNQEVYRYRTTMAKEDNAKLGIKRGDVTVVHPKWNKTTYSFTDDTRARGPETSIATFDVSWAPAPQPTPQPESCELGACAEALFAKRGCTYEVASNYNPDATFDDGSCVFSAKTEPVLIAGSFCIAGVNATDASSIQDMLQVLVGVVTGLTNGASFTFDLSTAPSCTPDDPTRRRLEDSASSVNAVYTVEVQSQKTEEIDGAVVILNDKTELNRELRQLSATATIVTASASVPSQAPSFATTSAPTLTRPPTLETTPQPTPGPKPDPTPGPTLGPTVLPTVPPGEPTAAPTTEETDGPTPQPTPGPTVRPGEPTLAPMPAPTTGPEPAPTPGPKPKPTLSPTLRPGEPTATPLPAPTTGPEPAPTPGPKPKPTPGPTVRPGEPTAAPLPAPTTGPEPAPTLGPKPKPTLSPTVRPGEPTLAPMPAPTTGPEPAPTLGPKPKPTLSPTARPGEPTAAPLPAPTTGPEPAPTLGPKPRPTPGPTVRPTGPTPTATTSTKMPTPEPTFETLAPTLGGCPALGVPDECPKDATGLPSCATRNLAPGGLCVGNAATCPDMPMSNCPASIVGDRRRLDDGGLFVFKIHGALMPSSTTSTVRDPCPFELLPRRHVIDEDHRAISTQAAPPIYSYSYTTEAPTMAPTKETMTPTATEAPTAEPTTPEPTATLSPTRTETYAPTRTTEAPSYAPTTETYAPTSTPTATGAPTAQ